MTQKNITLGNYPNDPSADTMWTAFPKVQANFTELYQAQSAPAAASPPAIGRYYWGVNASNAAGGVSGMNTNTKWCPFFMAAYQAFGNIGVNITTAVAGATVQLAIYKTAYGLPVGSPVYGPFTLSAATAGQVEYTNYSPAMSLDAGLYALGIHSSSDAVTVFAYTEGACHAIYGAQASTGADTSPVSAGNDLVANPVVTFIAASNMMPQIWIRR